MRKTEVEHLKAMLSRQSDIARLAYGHLPTDRPRQFIIIGTTNNDIYLKDITGNRRFWPVAAPMVDILGLKRDRDQIWAEASYRETNGASIRLKKELWGIAASEQQMRTVDDPWQELIGNALKGTNGKLLSADVWKIVSVDKAHRTQEHNTRIGNVMKGLGFERKHLRIDGEPEWCYARGEQSERSHRIYLYSDRNGEWKTSRAAREDEL
jgi:predicted P-loop ATPase